MDRRLFLKLAGVAVAATAFDAQPAAAAAMSAASTEPVRAAGPASAVVAPMRWRVSTPGAYLISGTVRLEAPLVEIGGIANTKTISWSGSGHGAAPVTSFLTYEQFDGPGLTPEILVRGGSIESLSITPVEL